MNFNNFNFPFPNVQGIIQGNTFSVRLTNEQLSEMLRKSIEMHGNKVKEVKVFPDAFVIVIDLSEIENSVRSKGLPAKIEPNEVKVVIDRKQLIEQFKNVTKLEDKGAKIIDKRDYVEIVGTISNVG